MSNIIKSIANACGRTALASKQYTDKILTTLNRRLDNLIVNPSTGAIESGDSAELHDIRVSSDGTTHASAGSAVRAIESVALGNYSGDTFGGSLDNLLVGGVYICEDISDSPFTYKSGLCYVRVVNNKYGNMKWIEQTFVNTSNQYESATRRYYGSSGLWTTWLYDHVGSFIDADKNLDEYKTPGSFAVCTDLLPSLYFDKTASYYSMLTVERFNGMAENYWVVQRLTVMRDYRCTGNRETPFQLNRTYYSSANSWTSWGTNELSTMESNPNLNDHIKMTETVWVNGGTIENNCPVNGNGILSVDICGNSSTDTALVRQIFTRYNTQVNIASEEYIRYISYNRGTGSATYNQWRKFGSHVSNKTIVCFGDSVFGNFVGDDGVTENIRSKTGAEVYNVAFGGTRYTDHVAVEAWKYFDFKQLIDSVVAKDFSNQDNNLAAVKEKLSDNLKTRYQESLDILKSIDFNNVDYVVLHYGTNDWANNECTNNDIKAAMKYGISKLINKYQNIRVLIVTPTTRFTIPSSGVVTNLGDTFEKPQTGYLYDTVDTIMTTAKEMRIPVLDDYYSLGWNEYNARTHFEADGTHPNAKGRRILGFRIGSYIEQM